MTKILNIPSNQILIDIAELNEELRTEEQIKELLKVDTSYLIINGYLETSSYLFIEPILTNLLSLSKNRLIDIGLPFSYNISENKLIKSLARYIIFDKKLRGIRICHNNDWALGRCEYQPPPIYVQRFYRQNNIDFDKDQMLVGSFYLQFNRCRIGLIFQSQIINNGALLKNYERYKCDALTIFSDIPKQRKKNKNVPNPRQKQVHNKLKKMAENCAATIIYAGLRIAPPSLDHYYDQRSYILQGEKCLVQTKGFIGENVFTTFLSDLDLLLAKKLQLSKQQENIRIDNGEAISPLYVGKALKRFQQIQHRSRMNLNKKYLNETLNEGEIALLNLWYIYKTVNEGSPFVLPYPLTQKSKLLFTDLIKLQEYCVAGLDRLIKLFMYKNGVHQIPRYDIRLYNDLTQMVDNNIHLFPKFIYLYLDDQNQVWNLKNTKYGEKICNCDFVNPHFAQDKKNHQGSQKKLNNIQIKKVQNGCTHVLRERYQTIDSILQYFRDLQFSSSQIEHAFYEILPKKIQRGVKLIPMYLFLLHSNKETIQYQIGEAQIRLLEQTMLKNKNSEEKESNKKNSTNFLEKVQVTKKYKNGLANSILCHRCDFNIRKNLVIQCGQCKQGLCFQCIDILTNRTLGKIQQYNCMICSKKCKCQKCTNTIPKVVETKPKNDDKMDIQGDFLKNFDCAFCEIISDKKRFIMFECSQCKNNRCLTCHRNIMKTFSITQPNICSSCQKFNSQKPEKQAYSLQIPLSIFEKSIEVQNQIRENIEKKESILQKSQTSNNNQNKKDTNIVQSKQEKPIRKKSSMLDQKQSIKSSVKSQKPLWKQKQQRLFVYQRAKPKSSSSSSSSSSSQSSSSSSSRSSSSSSQKNKSSSVSTYKKKLSRSRSKVKKQSKKQPVVQKKKQPVVQKKKQPVVQTKKPEYEPKFKDSKPLWGPTFKQQSKSTTQNQNKKPKANQSSVNITSPNKNKSCVSAGNLLGIQQGEVQEYSY